MPDVSFFQFSLTVQPGGGPCNVSETGALGVDEQLAIKMHVRIAKQIFLIFI
jgi:hypothetical protein